MSPLLFVLYSCLNVVLTPSCVLHYYSCYIHATVTIHCIHATVNVVLTPSCVLHYYSCYIHATVNVVLTLSCVPIAIHVAFMLQ